MMPAERSVAAIRPNLLAKGKRTPARGALSIPQKGDQRVAGSVSTSVELGVASRYEVDEFMRRIRETDASPLSLLTDGLHIHTLSVRDEAMFLRITEKLSEMGILVASM